MLFISTDNLLIQQDLNPLTKPLIKEIKISGKEQFYLSTFDEATKKVTDKELCRL